MKSTRIFFKMMWVGLVLGSLVLGAHRPVISQDKFPGKQVVIIIPFTVGGGTDAWGRTFAAALSGKKYSGCVLGEGVVEFVHGEDPDKKQKIEDFAQGRTMVLISTTILREGVNIPIIANIINAVGGRAVVDLKQWMGRGERKHGDETSFTMHDFYDRGPYVERHSKARLAAYRKEGLDITLHYDPKIFRKKST